MAAVTSCENALLAFTTVGVMNLPRERSMNKSTRERVDSWAKYGR